MKPLSKFLVVLLAIAAVLLIAAGPPNPILNLRLDSDANGNNYSWTNLLNVGTAGKTIYKGDGSQLAGVSGVLDFSTNNFHEIITNGEVSTAVLPIGALVPGSAAWVLMIDANGSIVWSNVVSAVVDGDAEYMTNILLAAINPGSLTTGLIVSNSVSGGVATLVLVPSPAGGGGGSGSGTVTSITFTGDGTVLSSTPSGAVTTAGTVMATIKNQSANIVLAGPTSGGAAAPTFRSLVAADVLGTALPANASGVLTNNGSGSLSWVPVGGGISATIYYVNTNGSSANSGLAPTNAWPSFSYANANAPSNSIILGAGGQIESNQFPIVVSTSGLTFGSYGQGQYTLTSSNYLANGIFQINAPFLTFSNLCGIGTTNAVTNSVGVPGQYTFGDFFYCTNGLGTNVHDLSIVSCTGSSFASGFFSSSFSPLSCYNWNVSGNLFYDCGFSGVYLTTPVVGNTMYYVNLTMTNNTFTNIFGYTNAISTGLTLICCSNFTVSGSLFGYTGLNTYNNTNVNGGGGFQAGYSDGGLVFNNESRFNMQNGHGGADGDGFDADIQCRNTIFANNYSHDNQGADYYGFLCGGGNQWIGNYSWKNTGSNQASLLFLNSSLVLYSSTLTNTVVSNNWFLAANTNSVAINIYGSTGYGGNIIESNVCASVTGYASANQNAVAFTYVGNVYYSISGQTELFYWNFAQNTYAQWLGDSGETLSQVVNPVTVQNWPFPQNFHTRFIADTITNWTYTTLPANQLISILGGGVTQNQFVFNAGPLNYAAGGVGGSNSTGMGWAALFNDTSGTENTAYGSLTLFSNTVGSYNVADGVGAMFQNVSGSNNTAAGTFASYYNIVGNYNTSFGYAALGFGTSGSANTGIGFDALYSNTASNNTAVGTQALYNNITGLSNVAEGYGAGYGGVVANGNTALGYQALFFATGGNNTAVGDGALANVVNGTNNIGMGQNAGINLVAGNSNNIDIGNQGRIFGESNVTRIGSSATVSNFIYGLPQFPSLTGGASYFATLDSIGNMNAATAVTSVTFTGDGTILSSTPSVAVTTTGTVTATLANANANTVWAGPPSGGAAAPTYQTTPTFNGTNIQGVIVTNNAQLNYEPYYSGPGTGVNGISWAPATNVDIVSTRVWSNIPPLILYTNTSGSLQNYTVGISNQVAAVLGASTFTISVSNANSSGWSNVATIGMNSLITSIAMLYSNSASVWIDTNAVLAMTNTSTGTGNAAGEIPNTGCIVTIGNATASGVPSLGGNNVFTGTQTYSFHNGSNVVVSQTGLAVNGGTYTGNAMNTSNAQVSFMTVFAFGNTISSTVHYLPLNGFTTATGSLTNDSTFLPGITLLSVIHGCIQTAAGGALSAGSNVIVTVYTNGNGTGAMNPSALTSTFGPNPSFTTSPLALTNCWISLGYSVAGAGTFTANGSFTLSNQ